MRSCIVLTETITGQDHCENLSAFWTDNAYACGLSLRFALVAKLDKRLVNVTVVRISQL